MTEEQWIELIITEIGGDTADALLANTLPTYWAIHSDAPSDASRALLVKIDGIRLLLGQAARQVDFRTSSGSSVSLSDLFDHFRLLLSLAESQVAAASSAAGGGIAVGQLTTTAPIMPERGQLSPNARRYRGDPLERS